MECGEDERDVLGQGGSGTVIYRAQYRGSPVAVKRFHFKKCRQRSLGRGSGTSAVTAAAAGRGVRRIKGSVVRSGSLRRALARRDLNSTPLPTPSISSFLLTVTLK